MVLGKFECKYLFSVTSGKNDNNVLKKNYLQINVLTIISCFTITDLSIPMSNLPPSLTKLSL